MSKTKQFGPTLVLGAIALGLAGTARPAPGQSYSDPVYEVQQALQIQYREREDPLAPKAREEALKKTIQQLRTIGELRRALALTGWRDQVDLLSTSKVYEGRPGAPKRGDPLVEIDREARKVVGERLAKRIQEEATRGDPTNRLAVVHLLGDMGTNVRALGDAVMWHGDKYLDWRGYARRFTPLLVKLTRDPDAAVRAAAARALGKINPDVELAVPALQHMLQHDAVPERRAAADGLASMVREINNLANKGQTQSGVDVKTEEVLDVSTAVTPAAGLGVDDADVIVRRLSLATLLEAANTLNKRIEPLSSLIRPYDPKELPPPHYPLSPYQLKVARELAEKVKQSENMLAPLTKVLAAQGERLARAINDTDPEVRLLASRVLEYLANSRLRLRQRWEGLPHQKTNGKAASAQLQGGGEADTVVQAAAQAKATSEEGLLMNGVAPALKTMARRLQDPNPVNRRAAIDFLEVLEDAAAPALPVLVGALSDPDIFVRWSAARTLGRIDAKLAAPAAVPALARSLFDSDLDVRLTAAATLEAYGPAARAAVPALAAAMAKGDAEYRRAVMYALQAIGPEASRAATPNLIVNLRHGDARVRRTSAETIGRFGPAARNALPALRQALRDEDADVRQAASDALLSVSPVPAPL